MNLAEVLQIQIVNHIVEVPRFQVVEELVEVPSVGETLPCEPKTVIVEEMIAPGALVIGSPLIAGTLGVQAVDGLLTVSLLSSVQSS